MKPCREQECEWFIQVRGKNPNTGQDIDNWGCAIAWMPVMQIETSQQMRQAGASIDSLRNNVAAKQIEVDKARRLPSGDV